MTLRLVSAVALVLAAAISIVPAGAAPAGGDLPGVRRGDEWLLRTSLSPGRASETTDFARSGDVPLVGDWNGDGVDDLGAWRAGLFLLDTDGRGGRAEIAFVYGRASDVPVVGDWDGDGVDGVGVRRGSEWLLRNRLRGGRAQIAFVYGRVDDTAVVGDWDGDPRSPGGIIGRRGPLKRYRLTVDSNSGVTLRDFGRVVDEILSDPRSWTGAGNVRFQRVHRGPAEIVIRLATPAAVDAACAPLRTIGYYSCTRGGQVILNRDRWVGAVPFWTAGLAEYRSYLVNHEVGHALGHGHVGCPGRGRRAPVMQQQSISLQGCVENGWPYP